MRQTYWQKIRFSSLFASNLRRADVWTLSLVLSVLGIIEFVGRAHQSILIDFTASALLACLLTACVVFHYALNVRWTRWVLQHTRRATAIFSRFGYSIGVDFRSQPEIAKGIPQALYVFNGVMVAWIAVTWGWMSLSPIPFREVATQVSYVAYIAGLSALWVTLGSLMLFWAIIPSWFIADWLLMRGAIQRDQGKSMIFAYGTALTMLTLGSLITLPPWIAIELLLLAVPIGIALNLAPPQRALNFVWRLNRDGTKRSLSWATYNNLAGILPASLLVLTCVCPAIGPESIGNTRADVLHTPTVILGMLTAWLCAWGIWTWNIGQGLLGILGRWHAPQDPATPSLHVTGITTAAERDFVVKQMSTHGWRVNFAPDAEPDRNDVRLHVGTVSLQNSKAQPEAILINDVSELANTTIFERLARRNTIQHRRVIIRGLQSLLRRAGSRRRTAGSGYWVGLHHWFIHGLSRDEIDEQHAQLLEIIPPFYRKVFAHGARHHFWEICHALDVDLLYVEDGVDFRSFRRVLRVLFEQFDIHAGRQPLREMHFAGLPKVRVILHDFEPQKPWPKTKYPEPDYEDISRARILHVFRDRGDDVERSTSPNDYDFLFDPHDDLTPQGDLLLTW